MPITSRGYRVALLMKVPAFDRSDLADLPRASGSGIGRIVRLGSRNQRYFVHHSGKSDIVVLETDDKPTRISAVREFASFLRGRKKAYDVCTLDKAKIEGFLRSLESERMFREGKLHVYYGDTATMETDRGAVTRVRTKIVFNNRNVDEVMNLSNRLLWDIRGVALTLISRGRKHYGHVFFDAHPTARVVKVAMPMNDDLHEMLAHRLVDFL